MKQAPLGVPRDARASRWRSRLSLMALLALAPQACSQQPSQPAASTPSTPSVLAQTPATTVGKTGSEPCDCGPLDVVFAIDDTGSMGSSLSNLQAHFPQLINDISQSSNGDYRLGLVTFKDTVTVLDDLAAGNDASVMANVAALAAWGGGGEPEASDEALNTVLHNLAARPGQIGNFSGYWRTGARRFVVLLTDARPAGFDDNFVTGVDDVAAHARAVDAANLGIKLHAVYVPTWSAGATAAAILQDYAATSQGLFRQTQPNGADAYLAVRDFLSGCRTASDVWMQDHANDTGAEPHGWNPIYYSPDIKVCHGASGCPTSVNPVHGGAGLNHVFVNLRNDGPNVSPPGSASGSLYVYYTSAGGNALWNTDWTLIGVKHGVFLSPGEHREVGIPWNNVPLPGHYCLLARWVSAGDPMTFPEIIGSNTLMNTRNNNNIAWRNVDILRAVVGTPIDSTFTFTPVARLPSTLRFTAKKPIPGEVRVDLGDLFRGWKDNGAKGWGFKQVGETTVALSPEGGELQGVPAPKTGRATVGLSFLAQAAGQWSLHVSQWDAEGREDLGGVEYQLTALKGNEPATVPAVSARPQAKDLTTLDWTHDAHHVRYIIWRADRPDFAPGEGEAIATVEAREADMKQALSFTDHASEGRTYYYRVQSLSEGGEAYSDVVSAAPAEGNDGK